MLFNNSLGRFAMRAAAGLAMAASLASCGGSTYQVTAFVPARILTFGDESSLLEGPQGLKYSINGVSSDTDTIHCTLLPLWTQVLATSYNLVYANCNINAVAQPAAVSFSALNATVDDVQTQVDTFRATDTFNNNDMVTIWVGMHDVLNEYIANGSGDDTTALTNTMHAEGAQLANIVNSIANAGARVVLLTVPDMGLSPYAFNEDQRGDFDRGALLTAMTDAFNRSLRANVINDGSKIGLVLPDDYVKSAVKNPNGYGFIALPNETAGCSTLTPLPNCTQDTLVTVSNNSNSEQVFLWADDTHLGAAAQLNIGNQAVSRAHSNPF